MQELNLSEILENTSDFKERKKVWYVAIIGRPNTGKSTFINTLIWEKIAITSNIPQTTRKRILAIFNDSDSQIIFFDTPWIHKSEKDFNKAINHQAIKTLDDSDLVLYFVDSSRKTWEEEKYIEELLEKVEKPILKVFTKSDQILKNTDIKEGDLKISSINKDGFDELLKKIKENLKEWPLLFSEDFYTKQTLTFRISEIIREKVFLNTKEELPHSTFIQVDEIEDTPKMYRIVAYIYTETDSQKYIVIWKWWKLIQEIWTLARTELEEILGKKVFLALRVKVRKNWRKDEKFLENMLK
jgi:GTP-binding protein Era